MVHHLLLFCAGEQADKRTPGDAAIGGMEDEIRGHKKRRHKEATGVGEKKKKRKKNGKVGLVETAEEAVVRDYQERNEEGGNTISRISGRLKIAQCVAREELWRSIKFVDDEMMGYQGEVHNTMVFLTGKKYGESVSGDMGSDRAIWDNIRPAVQRALVTKRSSSTVALKKKFQGGLFLVRWWFSSLVWKC